ncbi:MAG: C10 family peptidase, partial [Muribaculaceae bacterium]|nr:C10 family peptidase [Muribaculaceae bacterium]
MIHLTTIFHRADAARTLVACSLFLSFFGIAQARSLSESEARQVAKSFFSANQITVKGDLTAVQRTGARRAPGQNVASTYYVYNAGSAGDGYVIVSGDDRAYPVLGYSDTGSFDPANVPPALQEWLDAASRQIEALGEDYSSGDAITYSAPKKALASIKPMVTCKWDQEAPFNTKLPIVANNQNAYTGCVATAMAQLMYYYKWPTSTSAAIPAYTTKSKGISMPSLPTTTFDWSSMKDYYRTNDTGTAADAVAKLFLYCDQALNMDFKDDVSSASTANIPEALMKYFRYAQTARYTERSRYSNDNWESMVYEELKAKRPVIYRGETMAHGGHSFICDGYDSSTGMYHFNWGWSGASDGYYLLTVLKPQFQGIGSSNGIEGYIVDQGMLLGVAPNTVSPSSNTAMSISEVSATTTSYSRSSASSNFTNVTWKGRFSNRTGVTRDFTSGWALYKDGAFVKYISNSSESVYNFSNLQNNYGRTSTFSFTIDSSLPNGTNQAIAVSTIKGANNWELCEGCSVNYVELTITSSTLTL